METNINYKAVGAFVLFLLSCIILAIIWLSSGFSRSATTIYQVNMDESVSGISTDSPVEFNGLNVGKVKGLSIDPNDPRIVILLLRIKSNTPITQGTRATMSMRGLTGISYISLQDRGDDKTALQAAKGQDYPVIKTTRSFYVRLDETLNQLSDSIATINKSLASLLDEENLKAFKLTLGNMQRFTNTLATNSNQLNRIMQNTARVSEVLDRQTLPAAVQAINNFSELSSELKQNPSMLIRGKSSPPLGPGER